MFIKRGMDLRDRQRIFLRLTFYAARVRGQSYYSPIPGSGARRLEGITRGKIIRLRLTSHIDVSIRIKTTGAALIRSATAQISGVQGVTEISRELQKEEILLSSFFSLEGIGGHGEIGRGRSPRDIDVPLRIHGDTLCAFGVISPNIGTGQQLRAVRGDLRDKRIRCPSTIHSPESTWRGRKISRRRIRGDIDVSASV